MNARPLLRTLSEAFSGLWRSRGFAAYIVLFLGLCLGVTTTFFHLLNRTLLASLPFRSAQQLVFVKEHHPQQESTASPSVPEYDLLRSHSAVSSALAFRFSTKTSMDADEAAVVQVGSLDGDLAEVLGVRPVLGRGSTEGDPRSVILSHSLWQSRFGQRSDVIGETIKLDADLYTIVGVLPTLPPVDGFSCDLWAALEIRSSQRSAFGRHGFGVLARLQPGAQPEQVANQLGGMFVQLHQDHLGNVDPGMRIDLTTLADHVSGRFRTSLLALYAASVILLLIVCFNCAGMLASRSISRAHEMATRLALGATRARLAGLVAGEALLLAVAGTALGLLITHWAQRLALWSIPLDFSGFDLGGTDPRLLFFAAGATLLTAALSSAGPVLAVWRREPGETLRDSSSSVTGRPQRWWRAMVTLQITLTLALLFAGGLLMQSFLNQRSRDTGYAKQNLLVLELHYSYPKFKSAGDVNSFLMPLLGRMRSMEGVPWAAVSDSFPLLSAAGQVTRIEPDSGLRLDSSSAHVQRVSPGYFQALDIEIAQGRPFQERDLSSPQSVAVVNRRLAEAAWPDLSALGARILVGNEEAEVVGVASDIESPYDTASPYRVYQPSQLGNYLVVRTRGDPLSLAPRIRAAVQGLDREVPVVRAVSSEELFSRSNASARFRAATVGFFALGGLAVSALGIFGLLSYWSRLKSHELGIRLALGAQPRDLAKHVLWQGFQTVSAGLVIGLALCLAGARLLQSQLYGIESNDLPTLLSGVLLIGLISLAASYPPALRATRLDPKKTLRVI